MKTSLIAFKKIEEEISEVLDVYKEARNVTAAMSNMISGLDLAIKKYYMEHNDLNGRYLNLEQQALCKLAYYEAIEEKDFEVTENNIKTLFEIVIKLYLMRNILQALQMGCLF